MVVMYLVNATGTLRVSKEGELYGLDLHEHGISAYPEYVISALAAPGGLSADQQQSLSVATKPLPSTLAFEKTTGSF